MSGSDSDYVPGHDGEVESDEHNAPSVRGWSTSGTEDEESDFFEDDFDAGALLQTLEQQQAGDPDGAQPFELIRQHREERRRRRADHEVDDRDAAAEPLFGVDPDDIWNDPVAEKVAGLGRRKKKKGKARGAKASKAKAYSEEVARKMGQAHVSLMSKPHEALDLLNEIIRMAPNTLEAWRLLGQVQEALGNPRKALDCYMLAGACGATNHGDWKRLADLSAQFGFFRQAVHCLGKAIKMNRTDIDARWARAELLSGLNEVGRALAEYQEIGRMRPGDPEVATRLAKLHFYSRAPNKAIAVLEQHMKDFPGSADLTHVNILAELYMEQGQLADAVRLIERSARVMCTDAPLPLDLTVKMAVCQLRLGDFQSGTKLLTTLEEEGDPLTYHDLYMEVAATQTSLGRHDEAARYYQRLLDVPEISDQPLIWRQLAASLRAAGRVGEAVALYESRMDNMPPSDPLFMEAALTLAEMWTEAGQTDKVVHFLRTLDQMLASKQVALPEATGEQLALFVRKNNLHMALGQGDSAVVGLLPLLTAQLEAAEAKLVAHPGLDKAVQRAIKKKQRERASGKVRNREQEGPLFAAYSKGRDRRKRHVREADRMADEILSATEGESEHEGGTSTGPIAAGMLHDDTMFPVFVQLCEVMVANGQLKEVESLLSRTSKLMTGKSQDERRRRDVLRLLLADALCAKKDYQAALAALKASCMRWPHSWGTWNRFSQLYCTMSGGTISWIRFVSAMRTRHPTSVVLMLLQGHSYAMNQSWRAALGEYFQACQFLQDEPLVLLCIGVAYIHLAMSKRVTDRNRAILQGFTFLEHYRRARGNDQEALYNMGRAAHQLGLNTAAVAFYERALQVPPLQVAAVGTGSIMSLDLCKEIAHNLVLIYSNSGAVELARRVMAKYLVIR